MRNIHGKTKPSLEGIILLLYPERYRKNSILLRKTFAKNVRELARDRCHRIPPLCASQPEPVDRPTQTTRQHDLLGPSLCFIASINKLLRFAYIQLIPVSNIWLADGKYNYVVL